MPAFKTMNPFELSHTIRLLREPFSCTRKPAGREILLSRKKRDIIHDAYGEYVFSQLTQYKMQK